MSDHPLLKAYLAYETACMEGKFKKDNCRKEFAEKLRHVRNCLNMTVRDIGEVVGTTGSFINQIETKHKSILKREQIELILNLCYNEESHSEPKKDLNLEAVA